MHDLSRGKKEERRKKREERREKWVCLEFLYLDAQEIDFRFIRRSAKDVISWQETPASLVLVLTQNILACQIVLICFDLF